MPIFHNPWVEVQCKKYIENRGIELTLPLRLYNLLESFGKEF